MIALNIQAGLPCPSPFLTTPVQLKLTLMLLRVWAKLGAADAHEAGALG